MKIDRTICGLLGTLISATGASLSVTELQAIISITVTIIGFIVSVLVPLVVKLINKIKAAKQDGVITPEEAKDIVDTSVEIAQKTGSLIKEVSENKSEGEDK